MAKAKKVVKKPRKPKEKVEELFYSTEVINGEEYTVAKNKKGKIVSKSIL